MTEVRSFSVSSWNRELINQFDKIKAPLTTKVMWAVQCYIGGTDGLPQFYGDISYWVDYIQTLKKSNVKKFGERLEQINRIFGDVK